MPGLLAPAPPAWFWPFVLPALMCATVLVLRIERTGGLHRASGPAAYPAPTDGSSKAESGSDAGPSDSRRSGSEQPPSTSSTRRVRPSNAEQGPLKQGPTGQTLSKFGRSRSISAPSCLEDRSACCPCWPISTPGTDRSQRAVARCGGGWSLRSTKGSPASLASQTRHGRKICSNASSGPGLPTGWNWATREGEAVGPNPPCGDKA